MFCGACVESGSVLAVAAVTLPALLPVIRTRFMNGLRRMAPRSQAGKALVCKISIAGSTPAGASTTSEVSNA